MKLITPIFKKPYIELETEQEEELFKLDKDKEIERLNNIISELIEDITYLLEIINRNEPYIIKVYQDEWIAIRSAEEKIKELKGSDKE